MEAKEVPVKYRKHFHFYGDGTVKCMYCTTVWNRMHREFDIRMLDRHMGRIHFIRI